MEINIHGNIKHIGTESFSSCEKLNTLNFSIIDDTVETIISSRAFSNCTSLHEIFLPEGIAEIGEKTFANCNSLEEVVLPKTLKKIGYGAFEQNVNLRFIKYRGTNGQWNTVKKENGWNKGIEGVSVKYNYK